MDDFELEIKKDFIEEALLNLQESEGAFMELESTSDSVPLLNQIFRLAHNLKGGSRAVGFGQVAEFTHELENLVLKIQKSEVALNSEVITTLLKANDRIVEMLSALKTDLNATFSNGDLLSEMKSWLEGRQALAHTNEVHGDSLVATISEVKNEQLPPEIPSVNDFFEPPDLSDSTHIDQVALENLSLASQVPISQDSISAPISSSVSSSSRNEKKDRQADLSREDESVRVNLSRINLLNDLVGELIVTQAMVQQQALNCEQVKVQASLQQMIKLSKDIQSLSMGLRMLPVKPMVQKLQRVVRDTANALNKDVELILEGDGLDIDKSVLDRLADPLIHILRNAVDHGLEDKEQRSSSGKSSKGLVKLTFANEGNHLQIIIEDDGKGIDSEKLKRKGLEKGLLSEHQSYTEKQILHLIFHAGFSTKEQTSEISGRGVGMDVVKTNLEKVGGQIEVQTQLGKGTRFEIKIPLSLAVIEGLIVKSKSGRYVFPLSQVLETLRVEELHLTRNGPGIGDCTELRGQVVPVVHLDQVMNPKKSKFDFYAGVALVFEVEGKLRSLVVDEIVRSQQVVIKPLANGIEKQMGWIGTCVLGDGQPSLILNPIDLLQDLSSQRSAA